MTLGTKIEWAQATFNPWIGCTKVSPACDHCYAERDAKRHGWATWGAGQARKRTSEAYWRQPLAWDRKAAKVGKPLRVFCASLADVFDTEVNPCWLLELFLLIGRTPNLTWMLLTKRPAHALKFMRSDAARDAFDTYCKEPGQWPPSNIWLGVTAENQAMADLRVPLLLQTPAAKRFISAEPLLGPVDLRRWLFSAGDDGEPAPRNGPTIDWVITGGESGPHARPSHPDWFRSLRDQCAEAGVPFFFKQWGEWAPVYDRDKDDPDWTRCDVVNRQTPKGRWMNIEGGHGFHNDRVVRMDRLGKKASGRLLDGREWNEVPT